MFERFTDRARRIVVLAQEEARRLDHNYIGTEHILLGLIREPDGVAAQALTAMGISLEALRTRTEEVVGRGGSTPEGYIPFTPRAKKVLELSLREALQLGHNYVGTEHVLLAMLRERDGVGAQVLLQLGAEPQRVGGAVIELLSAYSAPEARGATAAVGTTGGPPPPDPPRVRTWSEPSPHNRTRWWEPLPERCVLCARDLWEADRYVSGFQGSVCERCVGAASRTLAATVDGGGSPRRVHMPPRLFGPAPSDPGAPDAVGEAFLRAFRPDTALADREHATEDGVALGSRLERIGRGLAADGVRLERVRFSDEAHAQVLFSLIVGRRTHLFEGAAVGLDGKWRVTRSTALDVLERLGTEGSAGPPPTA